MAYSVEQQAKIDAAQARLNTAKASYSSNVERYNDWTSSIQGCYKDTFSDAAAASTWYNPQKGPCKSAGSCDLSNCKNVIDKLNAEIIPTLRSAYSELNAAQLNYDRVLSEVGPEVENDPEVENNPVVISPNSNAADTQVKNQKWIFFGIVALTIIVVLFIVFLVIKKS